MTIVLRDFEEIIAPDRPITTMPHRFTSVFDRISTIEERADLQLQIDALAPMASIPANEEERKQRQADEGLRQAKIRKLRSKQACYAELNLASSTHYIEDVAAPSYNTMRHRKG